MTDNNITFTPEQLYELEEASFVVGAPTPLSDALLRIRDGEPTGDVKPYVLSAAMKIHAWQDANTPQEIPYDRLPTSWSVVGSKGETVYRADDREAEYYLKILQHRDLAKQQLQVTLTFRHQWRDGQVFDFRTATIIFNTEDEVSQWLGQVAPERQ